MMYTEDKSSMVHKPYLEVCADSFASCLAAKKGGADRVELCGSLLTGGVTPSPVLFRLIKERIDIKLNVLIRPRAGDFLYNEEEVLQMCREIDLFRKLGAGGFVIGALTEGGDLDTETLKCLIDRTDGLNVTLNRAFDMTRAPVLMLEKAIALGFDTVLTSGCRKNIVEGAGLLNRLHAMAQDRIRIMAGGGVTSANIYYLFENAGITAFHTSAKRFVKSRMSFRNEELNMGAANISEYERLEIDPQELKSCADLVHQCLRKREGPDA